MRAKLIRIAIAAAAACLCAAAPAAADSVGRAPAPPPGATDVGSLDPATQLHLDVVLTPRDPAALTSFIESVSDPASPLYRQYLARGEFAGRFGASAATVASVRASLRRAGLDPGPVSDSGLTIPVNTTAAHARSALHVGFTKLRLRSGRVAFANTSAPQLPPAAARDVRAIAGLDNLAKPEPRLARARADAAAVQPQASAPTACSAAASVGGYVPAQFASAYSLNGLYGIGAQGAGVNVALYELEPFSSTDISEYQTCFGTSAQVSTVDVDGGVLAGTRQSGEAALDIEGVIGLAPQASITVYRGPNNTNGPLHTYQRIVADDTAQVISTSWGLCEPNSSSAEIAAENTAFMQAATQGQTIFAASGDDGSEDCGGTNTSLAVDDPASQPYVTGVGGTTLHLSPRSETVWNNGTGAGGGGYSSRWGIPSWQSSFVTGTARGVPDVSADADPNTGYVVRYNSRWRVFGGTSAAAPLWAAILAAAESSGLGTCTPSRGFGLVNDNLYTIAGGSGYSAAFNDVRTGDNDFTGTNSGSYAAGTGYDLATGLGTPIAYTSTTAGLVPALCGGPAAPTITSVAPATGTEAGGTTVTINGTNLAVAPVSVSFGSSPATSVQQVTNTRITATAPAGTGTVPITVSDSYGTSGPANYTYTNTAPASGGGGAPGSTTPTTTAPTSSTPPQPTAITPSTSTSTSTQPTPVATSAPTRSLALTVSGALHYRLRRAIPAATAHMTSTRIHGTARVAGARGGTATIVYTLRKRRGHWSGAIRVTDRRARIVRRFVVTKVSVAGSGRTTAHAKLRTRRRTARLRLTLGRPH